MRIVYLLLILSCMMTERLYAQITCIGDEDLVSKVQNSDKRYKFIYVFCNYCQASQVRYPEVVKLIHDNKDMDSFFICAQDSSEIAEYVDTCKVASTMYVINQNRKRKMVSFYNPIKATCKFLKKQLGVDTDKMGASDFCVLDKDNKVIAQTNWAMNDEDYFKLLKESLNIRSAD
jgi:hypothetical protein